MEPLCKDKNNKINKCDDYGQHCVGEGMGGHPGAFTDVYLKDGDKCFTACGKKINKDTLIEYDFYMKLFDNTRVLPDHLKQFRNNMPKFYKNDTCKKEWKSIRNFRVGSWKRIHHWSLFRCSYCPRQ